MLNCKINSTNGGMYFSQVCRKNSGEVYFGSEGHNYVQIRLLIQKDIKSLYVQHNTILMPELTKTFCNYFSTESFGLEIEHNMLAFCESVCWELREVWQKLNNKLLRIMWDLACWLHTS